MLSFMNKGMLLVTLLLAGCGAEPSDRTAGGVTPDEARALDEAAEMVEARRLPDEALRPPVATTASASPTESGEPRP